MTGNGLAIGDYVFGPAAGDDREWFAAHPGRLLRYRPVAASDAAGDLDALQPPLAWMAVVAKLNPSGGARMRAIFACPLPCGDDVTDWQICCLVRHALRLGEIDEGQAGWADFLDRNFPAGSERA